MFSRQIDVSYADNYDLLSSSALTKTSLLTSRYWKVICDNLLDSPWSGPGPSHDCACQGWAPGVGDSWPWSPDRPRLFPEGSISDPGFVACRSSGEGGTVFLILWAPLGHPRRIFPVSPVGLPRPPCSDFCREDSLSWVLGAKMAFSS